MFGAMQFINVVILGILGLSPLIYVPFIVSKEKRKHNHAVWLVVTLLLGLVQCMGYLMILLTLGIKL